VGGPRKHHEMSQSFPPERVSGKPHQCRLFVLFPRCPDRVGEFPGRGLLFPIHATRAAGLPPKTLETSAKNPKFWVSPSGVFFFLSPAPWAPPGIPEIGRPFPSTPPNHIRSLAPPPLPAPPRSKPPFTGKSLGGANDSPTSQHENICGRLVVPPRPAHPNTVVEYFPSDPLGRPRWPPFPPHRPPFFFFGSMFGLS